MYDYVKVVENKPVRHFLLNVYFNEYYIDKILLVSPYIGTLKGITINLDEFCRKTFDRKIPLYVITNEPENKYQEDAISILCKYDHTEIRFNESLHAKLYVCSCRESSRSFGLLGSANLTQSSIESKIELAMMIYGIGNGSLVINQLLNWGINKLRTLNNTKLYKKLIRSQRI